MKTFFLFAISISLISCTTLRRSNEYTKYKEQDPYYTAQDMKDAELSRYELGIQNLNRPLTEAEYQALQMRLDVKRLERNLQSSLQKNLYYKNKAFFNGDRERIEFLQIEDYADQLNWLENRRFFNRLSNYTEEIKEAIEQNDLILHMPMSAVRETWGEPDLREVSGSDFHGNERWTYKTYQGTREGYKEQDRVIFFENGRVVAWSTQ